MGDDTDCITELCLHAGRRRDHETDELLLDCGDFIGGKLVISLFVSPVESYKVLEGKRGGEAVIGCQAGLGDDLEEDERILRLLLFLLEGIFGCRSRSWLVSGECDDLAGARLPFLC